MIINLENQIDVSVGLLKQAGLPVADIGVVNWFELIGWHENGVTAAVGGIEHCGDDLLLRSVVVDPGHAGKEIGFRLVQELINRATQRGYETLYLMTIDAEEYFSKYFGFEVLARARVPKGIRNSSQFSELCPGTAILMQKNLSQTGGNQLE